MAGFQLNRLGIFLDRLGLLDYWVVPDKVVTLPKGMDYTLRNYPVIEGQVIDLPYFTLKHYLTRIRQFFCIHHYESLYRIPREGEQFTQRAKGGGILSDDELCRHCDKYRKTLVDEVGLKRK